MAQDADCLFGSATSEKRKATEDLSEKRKLLRRYDHLAAQALNPFGVSELEKASLSQLWEIIVSGNKQTNYFAEWPDKDPYRKGIAISRLAQVLIAAIEMLKDEKFGKLLDSTILAKAMHEAAGLLPDLQVLNGGKASQTERKITISTLGMKKEPGKTEAEVGQASKTLYTWLANGNSTLRALLSFLSQGGVFYAATCAEKAARSYVKHGSATESIFTESAKARLCRPHTEEEAIDDQACLFLENVKPEVKGKASKKIDP